MPRRVFFIWVILLLVVGLLPAHAQTTLEVQSDKAGLDFPNAITFTLKASSVGVVDEVYLEYGTNARSCVQGVARQEADLTPGDPFMASWEWDFKNSGSLPPGAEVWWQWEVRTASTQVRTERQTLVIEDSNLTWQHIENDQAQVVWSEGSQAFARSILDLATRSLDELAQEAGLRPDGRVRLTVYPSFETLRAAALFLPEWTGGVAFPEYGVTILGIPVDSESKWLEDVVPHELAHLVTGERVFNCLGVGIPTWLNEGLSVYSETPSNEVDSNLIQTTLERGALQPLRNLAGGFPANADATTLAYAQSGEVVRYLIKTYGPEKMASLLAAVQSGLRINPALQEVYGFDTDGLDLTWRASLGFTAEDTAQGVTPTPARTAVPTLALWTSVVRSGTTTPEEVSAAVTAAPTQAPPTSTATQPPVEVPTLAETQETAPASQQPASGLPCVGGSALVGGVFLALVLPAARLGKSRRLVKARHHSEDKA